MDHAVMRDAFREFGERLSGQTDSEPEPSPMPVATVRRRQRGNMPRTAGQVRRKPRPVRITGADGRRLRGADGHVRDVVGGGARLRDALQAAADQRA